MVAPKLRFKEFEGDWEKKTLGEVVKFSNGRRIPLSESDRQKRQGTYRYYGASGVIDYIDDYIFDGQYILIGEDGANILTRSSTLAFVVEGKFWVNNHAHIFQSKKGDNNFLATYLESLNYEKYNSGTAQPKLNLENLKKVIVADPSKEEQTKIASFLSNVDEKISQLTQKHALLSQYKQGMMQKLFSQQIRFKADDGSKFGKWVNKKIIEIADYVDFRGKTPKKVDNGILLVTAKNIRFGYIDYEVSREYIGSDDFEEVMRRGCAKIGDVLITTEAPLGNVASVDREDIALAQRVIKYRGKEGILNNAFLKQKFLSEDFQALIASKATGGTVQGIKGSTLHNLEIYIPQDIEEQTKIANFLSSIDQKIEVVAQQIEQAKQWKKGLLQQMFV